MEFRLPSGAKTQSVTLFNNSWATLESTLANCLEMAVEANKGKRTLLLNSKDKATEIPLWLAQAIIEACEKYRKIGEDEGYDKGYRDGEDDYSE